MNPFPDPNVVSESLNTDVKRVISEIFKTKGSIEFYDFVRIIELAIESNEHEKAQILGFYCANCIINSDNDHQTKQELINGIYREIYAGPRGASGTSEQGLDMDTL
jgi:hypothetical protein